MEQARRENRSLEIEYGCTSIREIYYQHVRLFRKQFTVDNIVDKICLILDTPQWDLGLSCTSKGLVYGPLIIKLKSGEVIDCSQQHGGTLIPQNLPHGALYETTAKFGLIVEKDSAFQGLLPTNSTANLNSCILVTGKGYPDMNTRFLVKEIATKLFLPIFAIVDGDPHGIDIFFNYKYGSKAKIHINHQLVAPSIFWLGIHPTDMLDLVPPAVQQLTSADITKAKHLLKRDYVRSDNKLCKQVTFLIQNGVKCEIENITSISQNYLQSVYIPSKISLKKFI